MNGTNGTKKRRRFNNNKKPTTKLEEKIWTIAKKASTSVYRARTESKFFDTAFNGIDMTTAGTITHISDITQGDGAESRDGEVVTITSVQGHYVISSGDSTNIARIIIFMDKESIAVNPIPANVLESVTAGLGIVAPINMVNRRRFWVVHDQIYGLTLAGNSNVTHKFFHKLPEPLKCTFDDNATTPRSNAWYVLTISDSGAAPHPTLNTVMRLRFFD